MPSKPTFDDALYLIHLAFRACTMRAEDRRDELSATIARTCLCLGKALLAVANGGDLPNDPKRRGKELVSRFNQFVMEATQEGIKAQQKPAEN